MFDIDGTREAARQRALPQTDELPPAFRRLDDVCAPGYRGRKRGEVVRTRTTVSQAHSYQWLGSFGNKGNGHYREELRKGLAAITRYLTAYQLEPSHTLLRLDGQYGTGAALSEVAGFAFVTRGKDYSVLDHPLVQARLHLPLINSSSAQKARWFAVSTTVHRCRWDRMACCAEWSWLPIQPRKRKVPSESRAQASSTNSSSPTFRNSAFTACDVVELYLHRGAFEPLLSDLRTRRSIPTGGVAIRPGYRNAGN